MPSNPRESSRAREPVMRRRVLDTNVLINHWGDSRRGRAHRTITTEEAVRWGRDLIRLRGARAIVTPIYLEYVCGKQTQYEVLLARSYLGQFDVIDRGNILPEDWERARQIAERVPRAGSRRQLGDCLIRAICDRLHHEVWTADKRFPN